MDEPRVGDQKRAAESASGEIAHPRADGGCVDDRSASRESAVRINAERDSGRRQVEILADDEIGEPERENAAIEGVDLDRHFSVDDDVGQQGFQRRVRRETCAVRAEAAGDDELETVRAIAEIVKGLCIGGGRVGIVDPLDDGPAALRRRCQRGLWGGGIERLDGDAVIGLSDQRRDCLSLEDAFHPCAPVGVSGRRESVEIGKGRLVHGSVGEGVSSVLAPLLRRAKPAKPMSALDSI